MPWMTHLNVNNALSTCKSTIHHLRHLCTDPVHYNMIFSLLEMVIAHLKAKRNVVEFIFEEIMYFFKVRPFFLHVLDQTGSKDIYIDFHPVILPITVEVKRNKLSGCFVKVTTYV